jgi:hypothetical protein
VCVLDAAGAVVSRFSPASTRPSPSAGRSASGSATRSATSPAVPATPALGRPDLPRRDRPRQRPPGGAHPRPRLAVCDLGMLAPRRPPTTPPATAASSACSPPKPPAPARPHNQKQPVFQAGSNPELDTGLPIHPRAPASIGVRHMPLSRQRDLRSRSYTVIRNPEKRTFEPGQAATPTHGTGRRPASSPARACSPRRPGRTRTAPTMAEPGFDQKVRRRQL